MNSILLIAVLLIAPVVLAQESESSNSDLKSSTEPQGRARMSWSETADNTEPVKVRRVARGLSGGSAGANIRFTPEPLDRKNDLLSGDSATEQQEGNR